MIKIYSIYEQRPDFIAYQHLTFSKLLLDTYLFIICDNAEKKSNSVKIKRACKKYKLEYLLIPDQHHENPNIATSYPLDYLVQEVISKETEADISVIIDCDMFLINKLSIIEYLGNYKIAGIYQQRGQVNYLWSALIQFNHKKMKSDDLREIIFADSSSQLSRYYPHHYFNDKKIEGEFVDVGGPTYFFINKKGNEPKYISASRITAFYDNISLLPEQIRTYYLPFYSSDYGAGEKSLVASDMIMDNTFFHYRAGSNWNGLSKKGIGLKTYILQEMVSLALKGKIPKALNAKIVPDGLMS